MNQYEYSSQVWREHCEKVAQIEKARLAAERGHTRIGAHYVPPTAPVNPALEVYGVNKEPTRWGKIGLGILMVAVFMLMGYAL